jgi:predicted PurR-regulated permease PerM
MPQPSVPTDPAPPPALRTHDALTLLAGAAILALLYFGREILVPITLAAILSLLIAPLVRWLKRAGLGQVPAVLGSVLVVSVLLAGIAGMIVSQVVTMASSLPAYESTIRAKLKTVQDMTIGRMEAMQGEAGRMIGQLADGAASASGKLRSAARIPISESGAVPVEIHERPPSPVQVVSNVASSVWGPLGTAGIVLVVLVFALLEHESLRDRFIRLAGGADLRATTHALDDAGDRLSRFFVSQLAVNVGVGAVVGIGLMFIGLPQALLWAVLTTVLRFVPYVGVVVAALSAGLLGAAVDPGWALALMTLGLFAGVELLASQAVEPFLYGHSTGLSPLSVVIAAIFWSWIWGPVGLLLSTPLTLCLVVAGRHVRPLAFLDVLLGDTPALSLSQRFYQRALAGDADEIIAAARQYLKQRSFARYCDKILMPALRLASVDLASGSISPEQQQRVKAVVATVIETLGPDAGGRSRRRERVTVLDESTLAQHLRHRREDAMGKYQGPIEVPPGSIALCIGLGSAGDDLVGEILVRILRGLGIDARHVSIGDEPPPGADPMGIAMVFIVAAFQAGERAHASDMATAMRARFPGASIVGVLPAGDSTGEGAQLVEAGADLVVHDFEAAVEQARQRYPDAGKKPRRER